MTRRFASVHHNYTNYPYAFILKDRRKFLWGDDRRVEGRLLGEAVRNAEGGNS